MSIAQPFPRTIESAGGESVRLKEFVHDLNSNRRTTNATPHRVCVWKQTCHEKETVWTDMGSEY